MSKKQPKISKTELAWAAAFLEKHVFTRDVVAGLKAGTVQSIKIVCPNGDAVAVVKKNRQPLASPIKCSSEDV